MSQDTVPINFGLPLKTVMSDGSPPRTRLSDPQVARTIFDTLVRANFKRAEVNARVAGLVDGNPPFSGEDLKRTNQSWRSNFNDRSAEAFVNSAGSARYDIWHEAPTFAVIDTEFGTPPDRARWGRIITEEFQRLNREDRSLDFVKQQSDRECILFGFGPIIFEDPNDYHCRALENLQVLVPDGTPCDIYQWDLAVIRIEYKVNQLYAFIQNEEAATALGWNVEQVKKTLMSAAPKSIQSQMVGNDWTWYQQKIRENDFLFSSEECIVRVASILFREFPDDGESQGQISQVIIAETFGENNIDEFLFEKRNKFKDWGEYIHGFYYDRGNGKHHGVKGIGVKFFAALDHRNRFINSLFDAGYVRSQVMWKAANADTVQKLSIIQQGPHSIMPPGLEVVQINNAGVLDAPLAVLRELDTTLDKNLSQYRTAPTVKEGNPITAKEYQGNMAMRSALGNTELNRYYEQLDAFWQERFRRCVNPKIQKENLGGKQILEFQKRCEDAGVPKEALQKSCARAYRVVGQGSPFQRQAVLEKLMAMAGAFPEDGIMAIKDDYVASLAGQAAVDRYNPKDPNPIANHDTWEAMSENADIKMAAPVIVVPHQNAVIHLQVHFQAATQAVQSLKPTEGAPRPDPVEVLQFLDGIGQHSAQHLAILGRDPTRQQAFKALEAQFKQIGGIADQLRRNIKAHMDQQARDQREMAEAQAKAQQIQQGTDPATVVKTAQAQVDMQLQAQKTQADIQMKQAKTAQSMALADAKTASKIRNDKIKLAHDAKVKAAKPPRPEK